MQETLQARRMARSRSLLWVPTEEHAATPSPTLFLHPKEGPVGTRAARGSCC